MRIISSVRTAPILLSSRLPFLTSRWQRSFSSSIPALSSPSSSAVMADFRSDTVTVPSVEMRKAMTEAKVGDDVMVEDPTTIELEEKVAHLAGKEKGLYVPSGTMGNLICVGVHCRQSDEVIVGSESHLLWYEQVGISAVWGASMRVVKNTEKGELDMNEVRSSIRQVKEKDGSFSLDVHYPRTACIAVENTHNRCLGQAITPSHMEEVRQVCDEYKLGLHVDGARIFHSAAALNTSVSDLLKHADSASLCMSKGVGAPVGSVIVGSEAFIGEARRRRKMLGGGMRQCGIIAAGALFGLENIVPKFKHDIERAQKLGEAFRQFDHLIEMKSDDVQTNMVYFNMKGKNEEERAERASNYASYLRERGVLVEHYGGPLTRIVVHHQIGDDHISHLISSTARFCAEYA